MEYVSGNIFIREMRFDDRAGSVVDGHTHNFDHTTYCVRGSVKVEELDANGSTLRETSIRAADGKNWVLIKAGSCHRLTALEDNTVCHCVYAHRNPQGEVVQEYDGWIKGYE